MVSCICATSHIGHQSIHPAIQASSVDDKSIRKLLMPVRFQGPFNVSEYEYTS